MFIILNFVSIAFGQFRTFVYSASERFSEQYQLMGIGNSLLIREQKRVIGVNFNACILFKPIVCWVCIITIHRESDISSRYASYKYGIYDFFSVLINELPFALNKHGFECHIRIRLANFILFALPSIES